MMSLLKHTLASLATISGMLMPLAAHAYLTPEDVLDEDEFTTRYYDPPPSRRAIDAYVEAQQERSAARREAEQAALFPSEPAEELHGSAPDGFTESDFERLLEAIEALQNQNGGAATTNTDNTPTDSPITGDDLEERSRQRALERLRDQQRTDQQDAYAAWLAAQGYDETLHSGAPLSDTGPETAAAAVLLVGAGVWTLRRGKQLER